MDEAANFVQLSARREYPLLFVGGGGVWGGAPMQMTRATQRVQARGVKSPHRGPAKGIARRPWCLSAGPPRLTALPHHPTQPLVLQDSKQRKLTKREAAKKLRSGTASKSA